MKSFLKKHLFDLITGLVLVAVTVGVLIYFLVPRNENVLTAKVYRESENVLTVNLSELGEEVRSYTVDGKEGEMEIEAKHNAIRVSKSSCPSQYCVNQGWITSSSQSIICAHNAVSITIEGAFSREVII